jgi:very-short-patch-repair endonuclease
MRQAPTEAERKLWSLLRRGRLEGHRFRRQVPMAGYILDFCCLREGLGIEADGGQHYDAHALEYDRRRTQALAEKGFRILRFSDYDILKHGDAVAESIYQELLKKSPLPNPPPEIPGEGVRAPTG